MKKIVAINCSPRSGWNTAALVREAARGAESMGAAVEVIDLYKQEAFTGCVSCRSRITAATNGPCSTRRINSSATKRCSRRTSSAPLTWADSWSQAHGKPPIHKQ